MRRLTAIAALACLSFTSVAQAAGDPTYGYAQRSAPRIGAGAQLSLTVPLGGRRDDAGPRLSLRAGPSLTREAADRTIRHNRVAPFAELALRPGRSTTWSLAGKPIAQSLTLAGLREEQARRAEAERKGVSTLGAVGIGIGVLAVAAGIGLLVLIDKIEDNSE